MATALKLKLDIKKLEAAIKSKATPKSFLPKLRSQLDKSKTELENIKKTGKPPKKTTSTGNQQTLTALQKLIQKKKYKAYQGQGVDLEKDAQQPALPAGKRYSRDKNGKRTGKTYYEYRANRIDVKQPPKRYPKLEKGGLMADGGETGRIVIIPTYVVKEIKESVEMGYDTLVEGMIGRKRKGVMLINEDYQVRGTYDIGLKDAIEDLIKKIKAGNFKVDAIDKMSSGGLMDRIKAVKAKYSGGGMSDRYSTEIGDEQITVNVGGKEKTGYPVYAKVSGYPPQTVGVFPTREAAEKKAKQLEKKNKLENGGETSSKKFNVMRNVGKAKYVINYHDGEKTHKDGSPFYDIATFNNIKDFLAYKKKLIADGYKQEYKDGGYMEKGGGEVKVGDILTATTGVKVKVVEYDPKFGGRVRVQRMDEYTTDKPSQFMPLSKFKLENGGYMEGGETSVLQEVINSAESISKNQKLKTYVFDYEFDRHTGKPNSDNERYSWGYQEDVDYHKEKGFDKYIRIIHIFDNGNKVMARGGMVDYSKDGYVKAIRDAKGKIVKELNVGDEVYRYNSVYKTYNSTKNNELLHKSKYSDGGYMEKGGKTPLGIARNTDYIVALELPYRIDFYKKTDKKGTGLGSIMVYQSDGNWSVKERKYSDTKGGYYDELVQGLTKDDALNFVSKMINKKMADGGYMARGGGISSKTTYVPNRDVSELSLILNKQLKTVKGTDIVDGVYVKNSALSKLKARVAAKKSSAPKTNLGVDDAYSKLVAKAKEYEIEEKEINASIKKEHVKSMIEAGLDLKDLYVIYFGVQTLSPTTDVPYSWSGLMSMYEDSIKRNVDRIVKAVKENKFEIGLKYPNINWAAIIKKYGIQKEPTTIKGAITDYKTSKENYVYAIYKGKNVVIGTSIDRERYVDGKLDKDDYYKRDAPVNGKFEGGYWGIVTSSKEVMYDIAKMILSQKNGYVKDIELFINGLGGVDADDLDLNKVEYEDGGYMAKGGMLEVGDMVMVDDSGYSKYFSEFDTSKPAKIISKDKAKVFGKVKYLYGLEMADGRKPFNKAMESMLTKVSENGGYMKGGGELHRMEGGE